MQNYLPIALKFHKSPLALQVKQASLSALAVSEEASREALKQILGVTAIAGGLGVGTRALSGLLSAPKAYKLPDVTNPGATTVTLDPSLVKSDKYKRPKWIDVAGPNFKYKNAAAVSPLRRAADTIYDNVLKPTGLSGLADSGPITGPITNPLSKPWFGAAAALGMYGGGKAGWHAMNMLAQKHRENNEKQQLSAAEQEYAEALAGLHGKSAAIDKSRTILKEAKLEGSLSPGLTYDSRSAAQGIRNTLGTALSAGGALAALSGILSHNFVHNHIADAGKDSAKALNEAMFLHNQELQRQQPSPVQLVLPEAEEEQS